MHASEEAFHSTRDMHKQPCTPYEVLLRGRCGVIDSCKPPSGQTVYCGGTEYSRDCFVVGPAGDRQLSTRLPGGISIRHSAFLAPTNKYNLHRREWKTVLHKHCLQTDHLASTRPLVAHSTCQTRSQSALRLLTRNEVVSKIIPTAPHGS